jgi:uncharacterized membrane protein HdeD (DUF308 family)
MQGISAKGIVNSWGSIVFEGVMDLILGYILMVHPAMSQKIPRLRSGSAPAAWAGVQRSVFSSL